MSTTTISEEARGVLRAAGWNEGRRVDVAPITAFLEARGFSVPPVAADFLRQFHGFKARMSRPGGLSFLDFDVRDAAAMIEGEDRPYIDALVGAPLCPIGHGGGALLFLSPAGEMVILNDQWLGFARVPTIAEGMDRILGISRPPQYEGVALEGEQIPPGYR